jgi:hypothetical protein
LIGFGWRLVASQRVGCEQKGAPVQRIEAKFLKAFDNWRHYPPVAGYLSLYLKT